ncbi:MAG: Uncharacterised protein [Formosa sp. Hel1_33_131]|nr:MAG: Uncharacterised protein [Formosa sp. Hel1_33_131]
MNLNIKHIIYTLLFLNTSTFFGQINDPPTVTAVGDQIYCLQSQQRIVTSFNIVDLDDTLIPAFYIQISSGYVLGEDQLSLIGSHPNVVPDWNANQAKLILTGTGGGSATYNDMIAAVKDVVFNSSNINVTNKTFSLTAGSANYLASTDHYYDFVPANLITWTDAKAAAEAMDYFGLRGYLATLTIADEGQISGELTPGTGWIGGSDAGSEGVWKWMTGPEAGTTFWNGAANGSTPNYANWNTSEPNDFGSGEDYAHIKDDSTPGIVGSWNDLPNNTSGQPSNYQAKGYVVEYGGTPGDPVLNISGSTTFSPPQILSTNPSVSCSNESANMSATSNTTDILWYDSQNGGTLLHTGKTYSPTLMTSKTFWILASENGCTTGTRTEVTATVNPIIAPTFNLINSICEGDTLAPLPTTSNEGIIGSWSPALNNTQTTNYVFTPNSDQCANTSTQNIVVVPKRLSTFTQIPPICEGEPITLPTTSIEGFTGTWSPVFDNTKTGTYNFTPDTGQCANSTTMTITVNPIVIPTFTQVDTICVGDVLLDLPTVSINGFSGTWSPVLNNIQTTEYTFTPDPVSNICFAETKMTITVLTQTTPLFTQVDPICIGSVLAPLPTTSKGGITGAWSPSLNNLTTTIYTFTPDPGQCADTTTITIVVNPINTLTISAKNLSEDFDANQIISVTATGGNGDYEYQIDGGPWQNSGVFENVFGCETHTVRAREVLGCSTVPQKNINLIYFPKFFTPNNDGFNDTWNIKCLENQASAKIRIFDRYGKLIKQIRPSGNGWDGTYNGTMLAGSDYWFEINYIDSNGIASKYNAHFSLRL